MEKEISISQFIKAIERLPEDEPKEDPKKWYLTQKEHWLGWLDEYHGPGAYGRETGKKRDAKYVYNHIVEPEMLLYLIRAIPLQQELIEAAEIAAQDIKTMMAKSGAIRKAVPWSEIYQAMWGKKDPSNKSKDGVMDRVSQNLNNFLTTLTRKQR